MDKLVIADLSESNFDNRRVFVRVDFNVPVKDGTISEDYRIRRAIPTIDFLIEKGAKVIIGSHLGRPRGMEIPSLSLKPISVRLSELLGKPVRFMGKVIGKDVKATVDKLKRGNVLLLENLRFHREEDENDQKFSKELASLADIYVNDAFGTSHRKHASTFGMASFFDLRLAGFLVDKELRFLTKIREAPDSVSAMRFMPGPQLEWWKSYSQGVSIPLPISYMFPAPDMFLPARYNVLSN